MRFEERDLLLARLLECKTFQDAARVMNERLQIASRSVARTAGPEEPFRSLAPDPLERVALEALLAAARRGLAPQGRSRKSRPRTSRRSGPACATRSTPCSRCCPSTAPCGSASSRTA